MEKHHVLIVEDDATLLRGLRDNFRFKGYKVTEATDGRTGLECALAHPPDLVVLDIMMPEMDGFEVCKRLRTAGLEMPVVMLTAKGREEDIIRGLGAGAHDYMTKPFSIKELLARAESLLRRAKMTLPDMFVFGDNQVNLVSHKLFRHGEEVATTPKEFGLLTYFIKNIGRALTRDEIMQCVWGSDILVTPRSVDRCINTLRHKVEPKAGKPVFIQTIRDIGYRFEVPQDYQPPEQEAPVEASLTPASPWKAGMDVGGYRLTEKLGPRRWQGENVSGEPVILHRLTWLTDRGAQQKLEQVSSSLDAAEIPMAIRPKLVHEKDFSVWVEQGFSHNTLRKRLNNGALPLMDAVPLVIELAKGLATLHKQGILHLNIHAEFVCIQKGVRLGGLGLSDALLSQAKASGRGIFAALGRQSILGFSPQRLRGEDGCLADDIFGLGCLFYEMITGNYPFLGSSEADTLSNILTQEPGDLTTQGFPKNVWRIIARCLQKEPTERFGSMGDLVFALDGIDLD